MEEDASNNIGFKIDPIELKIEITRACNLRCAFCYLGDTDAWSREDHMPEDEVLKWIDWAVENNIPKVRFTGGEAVLHPKIGLFCSYAHLRGCGVVLNTNGMVNISIYDQLLVNDLRVSVPSLDPAHLDKISGRSGVLQKKIALIEHLIETGKRHVTMLTVLTPNLIGRLEEFVKFMERFNGLRWFPLRFGPSPEVARPITNGQMQVLAEEIADLMDRYPEQVKGIYAAAPFCSVKPTSLGARVFYGKINSCGPHTALNVNFDSLLMACYGTCELSKDKSLKDIKKSAKLHACCSIESLPKECQECKHVQRCGGGCRKPAGLVEYKGKQIDYLAGFASGGVQKKEA